MTLDAVQIRVLGALIEKEIVTPEIYPLSLNALLAASNQRSSRDPVMDLTEEQVRQALHGLEDKGLTGVARDSRVAKFEHRVRTVLNLRRDETAVICLLLLRGPQTPGELRGRADRLYSFDGIEAVQSTLERLISRPEPLAVLLGRQPGSREARYQHLLGGPISVSSDVPQGRSAAVEDLSGRPGASKAGGDRLAERLERIEAEVVTLRGRVAALEQEVSRDKALDTSGDASHPAA